MQAAVATHKENNGFSLFLFTVLSHFWQAGSRRFTVEYKETDGRGERKILLSACHVKTGQGYFIVFFCLFYLGLGQPQRSKLQSSTSKMLIE